MKSKFNKFLLTSISAFSFLPLTIIGLQAAVKNEISVESINQTSLIDLATQPLNGNVVYSDAIGKVIIDKQMVEEVYYNQSVLSTHSINTVRSGDHYFNFIKNPTRENLIDIIATPVNGNLSNLFILQTQLTSVDDSAIFINDNLVLIGTQGNQKFLKNYKIGTEFNAENNQTVTLLQETSSQPISSLFSSINVANKVYALSPISQILETVTLSNLILWPMGVSAQELSDNRNNLLHEVIINQDGQIEIVNFENNFDIPSFQGVVDPNDEIVSLTPLRTTTNTGVETKLYAFARGDDFSAPIKLIEFGHKKAVGVGINAINAYDRAYGSIYQKATLKGIVPYALVRIDPDNNFNFFWISQNGVERGPSATPIIETSPDALIEVKVMIDENNQLLTTTQESIDTLELFHTRSGNHAVPSIHQISYPIDNGIGDTYMGIRFKNGPVNNVLSGNFNSGSILYNIFKTGALPISLDANLQNESNTNDYVWNYFLNRSNLSAIDVNNGDYAGLNDINNMATYSDGILYQTGIFETNSATPTGLEKPFVSFKTKNVSTFTNTWTTSIPNNFIILPAEESNNFVGLETIPENEEAPMQVVEYNLPIHIADLNFVQPQLEGQPNQPPLKNSLFWYARYFIEDLQYNEFVAAGNQKFNLVMTDKPVFKDQLGNVLNLPLDEDGTAPDQAKSADVTFTVPLPYTNGQEIIGNPLSLKMTFMDNPNGFIENNGQNIVVANSNQISGLASAIASVLDVFSESKAIIDNQNVVGLENSNSLFEINETYLKMAFLGVESSADDFNGNLNATFSFQDQHGRVHTQEFSLSGFQANSIYLPSTIVPIVGVAIIVLVVVLLLNRKNKRDSKKSRKAGFLLATKLDKETNYKSEQVIGKIDESKLGISQKPQNNNATRPMNNMTRPMNNGTRPMNNATRPMNNMTRPMNNGTRPMNNGTRPMNNMTNPMNNATRPMNNMTNPMNNGTRPMNNGTKPISNPTKPIVPENKKA